MEIECKTVFVAMLLVDGKIETYGAFDNIEEAKECADEYDAFVDPVNYFPQSEVKALEA